MKKKILPEETSVSRKEALRRMGYAAFATSTMLMLLNNPAKAQQNSGSPDDLGDEDHEWDDEN